MHKAGDFQPFSSDQEENSEDSVKTWKRKEAGARTWQGRPTKCRRHALSLALQLQRFKRQRCPWSPAILRLQATKSWGITDASGLRVPHQVRICQEDRGTGSSRTTRVFRISWEPLCCASTHLIVTPSESNLSCGGVILVVSPGTETRLCGLAFSTYFYSELNIVMCSETKTVRWVFNRHYWWSVCNITLLGVCFLLGEKQVANLQMTYAYKCRLMGSITAELKLE